MENKKMFLLGILFLCILSTAGCQTAKGASQGIGVTVAGTAKGAAEDSKNIWQAILRADDWIKENLW